MRKRKTIKIDDRELTVKELTVGQILGLYDVLSGDASMGDMLGRGLELLPELVEGLDPEELKALAPSEIGIIIAAVREVNAAFFSAARLAGLQGLLGELRDSIMKDLSALAAGYAKRDMEDGSGTTGSASS